MVIGEFPKDLGLKMKDTTGKLIPLDDPRFIHFLKKRENLVSRLLWHTSDPTQFFQPTDKYNERFSELEQISLLQFMQVHDFPSKEKLMKERENVLREHPNTIFVGCHMGYNPDDLNYAAYLLDTYPNYYVDISAVSI